MSGPSPLVTTCALVAISPSPESTKPEPRPAALLLPGVGQAGRDDGHHAGRLALVDAARVEAAARSRPPAGAPRPWSSCCAPCSSWSARRRSRRPAAPRPRGRPPRARFTAAAPGRRSCARARSRRVRSPSMRSASSWAMARPRPEPWASSEVKKGSKTRSRSPRLIPVPKSVTDRRARAVAARRGEDDVGAGRGVVEGVVDEDAHDLGDALRIAQGLYPSAGQP